MQEPIKLELDQDQEDQLLALANKIYWHNEATGQFHEILSRNEKKHKTYIDADDRPGEIPPDGNGWTKWVRDYTARAEAAPEEWAKQLKTKQEWHKAEADFDPTYLARLSSEAYASRIAAHILEIRSQKTDTPLTAVQVAHSRWEALHKPIHRNFRLMTKTENGWKDNINGSIWHKNGDEWLSGPGEDTTDDENWETL